MNYYGATSSEMSDREKRNTALAREAAAESYVLLQNPNHTLPLQGKKIALYGMGGRRTVAGGRGSGESNPRYVVGIEEGLENASYEITSKAWLDDYDKENAERYEEFRQMVESKLVGLTDPGAVIGTAHSFKYTYPSGRMVNEADVAASETDTAIYVLTREAGEGNDRKPDKGDFRMTDIEVENVQFLCDHYAHVTLVINVGGMVDLTPVAELPIAIVYMVQGGMEGGNALADVLSGKVNFSGRLADTWPMSYEQVPDGAHYSSLDGDLENEYYTEGMYVGYRYYDSFGVTPRYPFGYGLSYTTFTQNVLSVSLDGSKVTAKVQVTNTGDASGREVVQVYLSVPGSVAKSLAAFGKTSILPPSASEELTLSFDLADNAVYNEEGSCWELPQGKYLVQVGVHSRSVAVAAVLTLADTVVTRQCRSCCAAEANWPRPELTAKDAAAQNEKDGQDAQNNSGKSLPEGVPVLAVDPDVFTCERVDYTEPAAEESEKVKEVLDRLTTEEQVELLRGGDLQNRTIKHFEIMGAGGKTAITLLKQGVPDIIFSDGPAGVNIMESLIVDENGNFRPAKVLERYNWGVMKQMMKYMIGTEGTHVYRYATAWPVELLIAQSWDTALLERMGAAVAEELEEFGITLLLAPAMNIHRNPLCGRNFEYYSEDPLVSGKMAAAYVRGIQSRKGVGATVKHFCCNNQEENRKAVNENVSEKALREIYLKGFEIAVKESRPLALMTSYNQLNGAYTGCRKDLIIDILRCEWEYKGLVMTDWDTEYNAAEALKAQTDLMMPGCDKDRDTVLEALKDGKVTAAQIRNSAARVLELIDESLTGEL